MFVHLGFCANNKKKRFVVELIMDIEIHAKEKSFTISI